MRDQGKGSGWCVWHFMVLRVLAQSRLATAHLDHTHNHVSGADVESKPGCDLRMCTREVIDR